MKAGRWMVGWLGVCFGMAGSLQASVIVEDGLLRDPEKGIFEDGKEGLGAFSTLKEFDFPAVKVELKEDQLRLRQLNIAMNAGRFNEALNLFEGFSEGLFSEYDQAYYAGLLLIESGRPAEAVKVLSVARFKNVGNPAQINLLLALAQMQVDQWADAGELLEAMQSQVLPLNNLLIRVVQTAQSAPKPMDLGTLLVNSSWQSASAEVLTNASILLHELKDFTRAEGMARRAVLADPKSAGAHFMLGYALKSLKRSADAREAFQKALQLQPDFPKVVTELALLEYEEGNNYLALLQLGEALEQEITNREAWNSYLALLSRELVPRDGLAALPAAPGAETNPAAWHWEQGVAAVQSDQNQLATRHLLRSLSLNLNDANVHNDFASLLYGVGHKPLALPFMLAAATLAPDSELAQKNLALLRAELSQVNAAERAAALRSKLDSEEVDLTREELLTMVRLYQQLKQPEKAVAPLEKALELDPENIELRLALAELQAHLRDYQEAIEAFHPILQLDPNNPRWQTRMAWLLLQQPNPIRRDLDRAENLARKACAATQYKRKECLEILIQAFTMNGKPDRAQAVREKANALQGVPSELN